VCVRELLRARACGKRDRERENALVYVIERQKISEIGDEDARET